MNEYQARSRRLPAYRAIVAVDTVTRSAQRSTAVPAVLEQTLLGAGMGEIWTRRHFAQRAGSGYFFGTSPEYLPFLIDPLLDGLQLALEDRGLRLRVCVHVGPVGDQVGEPVRYAFRLLGSMPLREVLNQANPEVTLAAAIVSQRVYQDVIVTGYTSLPPDKLQPVTVTGEPAWLYVPIPSRRLSRLAKQGRHQGRLADQSQVAEHRHAS